MTHFLFHLHECGVVTEDEEGRDLPDFESARHHAEIAARAIICAELEDGDICLGCHIEIENRDTGERHIVAFRDVVRIVGE
ncbi:hypothetical protein ASG11_15545 [Sphingomonas sp. Leaf357]|uniref:DUF6894 family protein n=1 Tax=Sphingomonas sp. Leaf357 TaxID=1736350 RepID=UPI0006F8D667|nr:hypothetical protein [Sphingomonas sp. Leaf357]KQS02191.1 hypothetical protein ASG11_15545 [Sphingomonas sp. Leaf357]